MEYLRAYVDACCTPEIGAGHEFGHLKEALYQGLLGAGWNSPNPNVGALIVQGREVVARAAHRFYGKEHAETVALRIAKERARNADIYVSLEPCTHQGKQPPCADSIIAADISRVVYAGDDPDARTCKCGRPALEAAGIGVHGPLLPRASVRLNDAHHARACGKLLVTLRLALSLDGRVALANGASQWITGKPARGYTHFLRQTHDAVMVGLGTVRADNPRLTVRNELLKEFAGECIEEMRLRSPARVVLDPEFELLREFAPHGGAHESPALNIYAKSSEMREDMPWLIFAGGAGKAPAASGLPAGVQCVEVPLGVDRMMELARVWEKLGELGINSLMIEGGAETARVALSQGAVTRLDAAVAPFLLGCDAKCFSPQYSLQELGAALRLRDVISLQLADDTIISGYTSDFIGDALRGMGRP